MFFNQCPVPQNLIRPDQINVVGQGSDQLSFFPNTKKEKCYRSILISVFGCSACRFQSHYMQLKTFKLNKRYIPSYQLRKYCDGVFLYKWLRNLNTKHVLKNQNLVSFLKE